MHVAGAEDDFFLCRLIVGNAEDGRRGGGAVEGDRQPRGLEVLVVDVGENRIAGGIVGCLGFFGIGRVGLRLGHRGLRVALAEQLFSGFLDETQ